MRIVLALPVAVGVLTLASASCVTRTVYVVDDNPRNDFAQREAPREAPRAAPPVEPEAVPEAAPPDMPPDAAPEEAPASVANVDEFYAPLSSYGQWVDYPQYGRVWVPSQAVVGAGFRPYTYGHWEYTEYGWTWVDHSPFGWATGHYGRWFYDGSYGWVWVPGTVWAPAWVAWRTGGAYAGWAPLPPGAEFGSPYSIYDSSWVFVPYGSLGVAYVGSAIIVGPGYQTCLVETYPAYDTVVVYGNTYYRGPDERVVERDGGHVVHRPARDIDREHPVTRPPSSVARTRPSSSSSGASRTRNGTREAPHSADRGASEPPRHDRRDAREESAPVAPRSDARREVPEGPSRRPARDERPDLDELNPNAAGRPVDVQPRPIETRGEPENPGRAQPGAAQPRGPAVQPRFDDGPRGPAQPRFDNTPPSIAPRDPVPAQPRFDDGPRGPAQPRFDNTPPSIAPRGPAVPAQPRFDDGPRGPAQPRFDNTPPSIAPRGPAVPSQPRYEGPAPIAPRDGMIQPSTRVTPQPSAAQAAPSEQEQGQSSSSSSSKKKSSSKDKGKSK